MSVIKPLTRALSPVLFEMMRLIRRDKSFLFVSTNKKSDIPYGSDIVPHHSETFTKRK